MLLLGTSNAFSNTDILGNTTPEPEAAPPDFYDDTDDVNSYPIDRGVDLPGYWRNPFSRLFNA